MELKIGRFGEFFQCQNIKEHQFPKNFKEYQVALEKYVDKYTPQIAGRKCEVCDKDLIVRVSKSSLKPYIACPEYKVGNKHTVTNIELDEVDTAAMPKKSGGKRFFKKKK
jgi:ssDNA-binding Zn-finger/Zn-ribbon topoisomerase 1